MLENYTRTGQQNCAMVYAEIVLPSAPDGQATLSAANSGCITPIIRRSDGSVEWIEVGGMPLGVGLGFNLGYEEMSLQLNKGDFVILTSDGIVEANNAADEMYGFDRFEQAVAAGPATSAEAMLAHLKDEVAAFVGGAEAHDDLTLVVVQV